jgi:hypothetical protein
MIRGEPVWVDHRSSLPPTRRGPVGAMPAVVSKVVQSVAMPPEQGRKKWALFHRRGLWFEAQSDLKDDTDWLIIFAAELPCGECRNHWIAMVAKNPPDWRRYFAWGVDRHNEVNARLVDKPQLTEAAARSLWHEPGDAVAMSQQAG